MNEPISAGQPITLAVVEDNPDVLEDMLFNLKRLGFDVIGFPDGTGMDAALAGGQSWSVLILDLGLPGEDGLSIARRLREAYPAMGIIALTARGRLRDRVLGLNEGIDLYLVKPTELSELAAAIRAVARRVHQLSLHVPIWRLECASNQLIWPNGDVISLNLTECHIMTALVDSNIQPVNRDILIRAIGRNPDTYDPRALEVTLSRLRGKLGDQPPLKAVRNQGYRFAARLEVSQRRPRPADREND